MAEKIIQLTKENFKEEIIESDVPVIIDFWAGWCMPCKMMAPVFESLARKYDGQLKFAKLNTDEAPEIASKFSIQGIPALVIVKQGSEIDRIVGAMPEDVLKQKIDLILEKLK